MANKSNIINPTMRTTACCAEACCAEAGLTACCAGGCPRAEAGLTACCAGGCPRSVSNRNLRLYQYDLKTLEENIATLCVKTIVNTQILTAEFCAKYILNDNYSDGVEEDYLYSGDFVLTKQKHITKEDLLYWIKITPDAYY